MFRPGNPEIIEPNGAPAVGPDEVDEPGTLWALRSLIAKLASLKRDWASNLCAPFPLPAPYYVAVRVPAAKVASAFRWMVPRIARHLGHLPLRSGIHLIVWPAIAWEPTFACLVFFAHHALSLGYCQVTPYLNDGLEVRCLPSSRIRDVDSLSVAQPPSQCEHRRIERWNRPAHVPVSCVDHDGPAIAMADIRP